MYKELAGEMAADAARIALVVSRFNAPITESLLKGASDALQERGVAADHMTIVRCPGAFEIPMVAQRLAKSGKYHAVVCLGAVIRGATYHFDIIANEVASGLMRISLETGVPVTLGVITTDTVEQAVERSREGPGNKGTEAAVAALEMAGLLSNLP